MDREFFKVLSQKPENVENFCNDLNNPFRFGCRKCVLYIFTIKLKIARNFIS